MEEYSAVVSCSVGWRSWRELGDMKKIADRPELNQADGLTRTGKASAHGPRYLTQPAGTYLKVLDLARMFWVRSWTDDEWQPKLLRTFSLLGSLFTFRERLLL